MVIKSSRSPGSKFMLKVFIALLVALGVAAFLFVSAARAEDGRVPSWIDLIDETYKIPELEAQGYTVDRQDRIGRLRRSLKLA